MQFPCAGWGFVLPRRRAPVARFEFEGNIDNAGGASVAGAVGGTVVFLAGLEAQALSLTAGDSSALLTLDPREPAI